MRSKRYHVKKFYDSAPRIITTKFDSVCNETGAIIKKGEQCLYYPNGKKVYAINSEQWHLYKCDTQDIKDFNLERDRGL